MVGARRFFKDTDLEAIEREVKQAEARTSGEIVPLVVGQSGDYAWVHGICALAGLVVVSILLFLARRLEPWSISLTEAFEWQALGVVLGAGLPLWSPIKRVLVPAAWARNQVHRECLASFVALGLHETRDRTGVLIYLSLLEHRVEILADRGIHEETGPAYWEDQLRIILQGVKEGRPAEGLRQAIRQIGDRLAERFPRRPDDTNELGDTVRFDSRG